MTSRRNTEKFKKVAARLALTSSASAADVIRGIGLSPATLSRSCREFHADRQKACSGVSDARREELARMAATWLGERRTTRQYGSSMNSWRSAAASVTDFGNSDGPTLVGSRRKRRWTPAGVSLGASLGQFVARGSVSAATIHRYDLVRVSRVSSCPIPEAPSLLS